MFNLNKTTLKINQKNYKYMLSSVNKYADFKKKKFEFNNKETLNDECNDLPKILENTLTDESSNNVCLLLMSTILLITSIISPIYIYCIYKKYEQ